MISSRVPSIGGGGGGERSKGGRGKGIRGEGVVEAGRGKGGLK